MDRLIPEHEWRWEQTCGPFIKAYALRNLDASPRVAAKEMAEVHGNRTPRKNQGKTAVSSPGGAKSGALSAAPPDIDPALAALIAAWPTLPDAIRAGIRAMIQPWEGKP